MWALLCEYWWLVPVLPLSVCFFAWLGPCRLPNATWEESVPFWCRGDDVHEFGRRKR